MASWFDLLVPQKIASSVKSVAQNALDTFKKNPDIFKNPMPSSLSSAVAKPDPVFKNQLPPDLDTFSLLGGPTTKDPSNIFNQDLSQNLTKFIPAKVPGSSPPPPSAPVPVGNHGFPESTLSTDPGTGRGWDELNPGEQYKVILQDGKAGGSNFATRNQYGWNMIGNLFTTFGKQYQEKAAQKAQESEAQNLPGVENNPALINAMGGVFGTPLTQVGSGIQELSPSPKFNAGHGFTELNGSQEKPRIVKGVADIAFGTLGATSGGAVFNGLLAIPQIQKVAAPAFEFLDWAKQKIQTLPVIKDMPQEVKDGLNVTVDYIAMKTLHKLVESGFKTTIDVEIPDMVNPLKTVKIKLPVDRQWWSSVKNEMNTQVNTLMQNPMKFIEDHGLGLSIKDVSKSPNQGLPEGVAPAKLPPKPVPIDDINPAEFLKKQKAEEASSFLTEAQEKARKVAENNGTLPQRIEGGGDWLTQKFADSAHVIEKMIEKNQKQYGYEVRPSQTFAKAYDDSLVSPHLAVNFMKQNGFIDALQQVPRGMDKPFQHYLAARQIMDIAPEMRAKIPNVEKYQAILDAYPEFEPLANGVTNYANKLLDYSVDRGLIAKETAASLKEQYPRYVPLNRIFNELEQSNPNFIQQGAPASLSKQNVVKKMKGSDRNIEDPALSLIQKSFVAFNEGERNNAASKLIDYKDRPGFEETFIPKTTENAGEIKSLSAQGWDTISRFVNGKKEEYLVPKEIAEFAKAYDQKQVGIIGEIAQDMNRVFKVGQTGINLPFALANWAKDTVGALINKEGVWKGVLDPRKQAESLKAAAVGDTPLAKEVEAQGIFGTSFDVFRDENQAMKTYAYIKGQANAKAKALYTVKNPTEWFRAIEDIISITERNTRINIYKEKKTQYMEKGMNEVDARAKATQDAREATANFMRKGTYAKELSVINPYLRAAIRGSQSFVKGVKEQGPGPVAAKVAAYGVLPVIALTAWNNATEERKAIYKDISPTDKHGSYMFITPWATKQEDGSYTGVLKIPKPSVIQAIATPFEQLVASDPDGIGANLVAAIVNPATGVDVSNPVSTLMPSPIKGVAENAANFDFFTKAPIVPESLQEVENKDQYKPGKTSATARGLASIADKFGLNEGSPMKMEHLIKSLTGEAGMQALNFSDQVLAAVKAISPEDIGGRSIIQGMEKRFTEAQGGNNLSKAHDSIDKSNLRTGSENLNIKRAVDKFAADMKNPEKKAEFKTIFSQLAPDRQEYAAKYFNTVIKDQGVPKDKKAIAGMSGDQAVEYWGPDLDLAIDELKNGDKAAAKLKLKDIITLYKDKPGTADAIAQYILSEWQPAETTSPEDINP